VADATAEADDRSASLPPLLPIIHEDLIVPSPRAPYSSSPSLPPSYADGSEGDAHSPPLPRQAPEYPSTRASRQRLRRTRARWARMKPKDKLCQDKDRAPAYKGKGKGPVGSSDRRGDGGEPAGSRLHGGDSTSVGLAGGDLAAGCRETGAPPTRGSDDGGTDDGGLGGGCSGAPASDKGGMPKGPAEGGSSGRGRTAGGGSFKGDDKSGFSGAGGSGRVSKPPARRRTTVGNKTVEVVCDFCPTVNRNGGMLPSPLLGPFRFGNRAKVIHIHDICASWAPEVFKDPETDQLSNVAAAYYRSRRLVCTVCGDKGATVGCYVPTCTSVHHFICLYGFPPPSLGAHEKGVGPCLRLHNSHTAFCPAHVQHAQDAVYVDKMEAAATLSLFLSNRAAAVAAALHGDPGLGTDRPNFNITGIRRNETETIFCRAWGVASDVPDSSLVTVVGRAPLSRVLHPGERLVPPEVPRQVRRTVLEILVGQAVPGADCGRPGGGERDGSTRPAPVGSCGPRAAATAADGRAMAAPLPPRTRILLLRNMRRCHPLVSGVVRRSLPTVPMRYLNTTVVLSERAHEPPTAMGKRPRPLTSGSGSGGPATVGWPRPAPVPVIPALEDHADAIRDRHTLKGGRREADAGNNASGSAE